MYGNVQKNLLHTQNPSQKNNFQVIYNVFRDILTAMLISVYFRPLLRWRAYFTEEPHSSNQTSWRIKKSPNYHLTISGSARSLVTTADPAFRAFTSAIQRRSMIAQGQTTGVKYLRFAELCEKHGS